MLTISNYHYIRENFISEYPSIFGITPLEFKNQLNILKELGEFVSPKDLIENSNDILLSSKNFILITFDDGLKEQFDFALPILEELKIPAIFFLNSINFKEQKVSTVHKIHLLRSILSPSFFLEKINLEQKISLSDIEKEKAVLIYRYDNKESAELKYLLNFKIPFDSLEIIIKKIFDAYFDEYLVLSELYMGIDNIRYLSDKNYLGSHTHSHYPLGLLKNKQIQFELESSKNYFEDLTNSKIEMVSYPYGTDESCTNQVSRIAKEVGYKLGFTTKRGVNNEVNNLLLLNRFDCNDLQGGKNY